MYIICLSADTFLNREVGVKTGQLYYTRHVLQGVSDKYWIKGKSWQHPAIAFKKLSQVEALIELGKQKALELP